jgi:hypothetical protein
MNPVMGCIKQAVTYIYRLLCGRNSGLQLLWYSEPLTIKSLYDSLGPPVTVFKQPG